MASGQRRLIYSAVESFVVGDHHTFVLRNAYAYLYCQTLGYIYTFLSNGA